MMNYTKMLLSLMVTVLCVQLHAYKEECWDALPGKPEYIPFGGERVDYLITTDSDMVVVGHGRIKHHCAVQLPGRNKNRAVAVLKEYPPNAMITQELIVEVQNKSSLTAQVLKDFQKMGKRMRIRDVLKALQGGK